MFSFPLSGSHTLSQSSSLFQSLDQYLLQLICLSLHHSLSLPYSLSVSISICFTISLYIALFLSPLSSLTNKTQENPIINSVQTTSRVGNKILEKHFTPFPHLPMKHYKLQNKKIIIKKYGEKNIKTYSCNKILCFLCEKIKYYL